MSDFLVHALLSNFIVATILGSVAYWLHRRYQAASLANLLWIVLLAKLMTPPIFSLPVFEMQSLAEQSPIENSSEVSSFNLQLPNEIETNDSTDVSGFATTTPVSQQHSIAKWLVPLGLVWLISSLTILAISFWRIVRFHLMLKRRWQVPELDTQRMANSIARQLGLDPSGQRLRIVSANVSPFVWWLGGTPTVVIPERAIAGLTEQDLYAVLSHEMAHIKRRDHWVRWLECLAGITFWWNPLVWWAKRHLRVTEEIACDCLVLQATNSQQADYANSLLNIAELLTTEAIRPPAVASAINSGGLLEKRLTIIMAGKRISLPQWIRVAVCTGVLCAFPLGFVVAQDMQAVERRLGEAVADGEITLRQAAIMLDALKESMHYDHDEHHDDGHHDEDFWREHRDDDDRSVKPELAMRNEVYLQLMTDDIQAAVEAGKMTRRDAELKLNALRQKMIRDQYSEAEQKLNELRVKLFELTDGKHEHDDHDHEHNNEDAHDDDNQAGDDDSSRRQDRREGVERRFRIAARNIQEALDKGEIDEEEAKERQLALRKRYQTFMESYKEDDDRDR